MPFTTPTFDILGKFDKSLYRQDQVAVIGPRAYRLETLLSSAET